MGISERLEIIENKLQEEEKEQTEKDTKKFRFPFGKKVSNVQKKKNYVTVFKVNENKNIDVQKCQIVDQAIMIDGVPRLGLTKYVMYLKKIPVIWLPSWRVTPFCPEQDIEASLQDGSNTNGYKILLAKMHSELTKAKKELGWIKWVGGAILIAVFAYAFITG